MHVFGLREETGAPAENPEPTAGITPGNQNLIFFQFDCAGKCASSRWCCEPARVWGNPIRIISSVDPGWSSRMTVHPRVTSQLRLNPSDPRSLETQRMQIIWVWCLAFRNLVCSQRADRLHVRDYIMNFLSGFRNKEKQQKKPSLC